MPKKSGPKYSGELAKSLPEPTFGEVFGEKPAEHIASLIAQKIQLLFRHYGIDESAPDPWITLTLRLAQDHVPGFRRKDWRAKKAGRPATWKGSRAMELHADVWELAQKGQSESNACRILSQQKYKPAKASSLLRRFKEVQEEHRRNGWSDDAVLDYVRLVRNPEFAAELRRAYAEILNKNSP